MYLDCPVEKKHKYTILVSELLEYLLNSIWSCQFDRPTERPLCAMFREPVRMAQPHQYLSPRCTQSSLMNDVGTVSSICLYTPYNSYKTRVSMLMSASSALLGAFEKLRKGTSSCLSVRKELGFHWTDFHEI